MFRLQVENDNRVIETADITFYTSDISVCLLACFDFALCEVAVYSRYEDSCQLFTTRGLADLTRTVDDKFDVFYRSCQGACT